jgi:hypothetical protein
MAPRRPVHRKQERRSISKTGLLFCALLAGGVMLVPIGGDLVYRAKTKVRDLALRSGLIEFNDCVVTPDHAIACASDAVGMPLPAALRQMADSQAQAAAEKAQRLKAETAVRHLALEIERLNQEAEQRQLADTGGHFPPPAGDVTPTGLTGAGAPAATANVGRSGADIVNHAAEPQSAVPADASPSFSLTPPSEED